ncbi:cyclase family protein, partial [Candidatus Neomarinimicrobiota bacterium]
MNREESMNDLIDISLPVEPGLPVWPGDLAVDLTRRRDLARGDKVTDTTLHFGVHTGTHIDASGHFLSGGRLMHEIPLEQMNGPVLVADFTDRGVITAADLEALSLPAGIDRLLCKTSNSELW